ncbi:hypothetical protein MKX01_039262 [Papaver californicum]|nr:hypothetical protein MKX01_039262 [Papaver californicum]
MCLTYGPVARVTGPEIKELGDRGLVAFENKEDAQMAIEKLNGSTFKGRVITVEWAKKNNVPDLKKNICRHCDKNDWDWVALNSIGKYVRNGNAIRVRDFAGETDRSDISSICRTFGPVACVFEHGLNYEGKRHLGLLAGFENKEDAQKAIEKFNGSVFKVRVLTVEWAKKKNENSP